MAKVNIVDVLVLDNPSLFPNPFQFEITFEALEDLSDDLEWKIIYVGAAESEDFDQTLETILVGPVPGGRHKFLFQEWETHEKWLFANLTTFAINVVPDQPAHTHSLIRAYVARHSVVEGPPDTSKIPVADAVGVTVVLLTCSYRTKEFIRVGYYVNNEYEDPELREAPPTSPKYDKLHRNILATNPRVTRFKIDWDNHGVENGENVPPIQTTSSESNQMSASKGLLEMKEQQIVPNMNTNAMDCEEASVSMP